MTASSVPVIRPATAADVVRIGEIMHGEPSPEVLGLVGDRERAVALGKGLLELEHIPNPARPTVVADCNGDVAGVLQFSVGRSDMKVGWDQVHVALRVAGPARLVRALPRLRARQRIDMPAPPGAFYVAELHVDPQRRGSGIGGLLLDWADDEAQRRGLKRMALTTFTTNRARHLYDRKGYRVTQTRVDAKYERYTGVPGRVLMEKDVPPS